MLYASASVGHHQVHLYTKKSYDAGYLQPYNCYSRTISFLVQIKRNYANKVCFFQCRHYKIAEKAMF